MLIIPAIDIRDGKCVRLYKGDYNQTTIYNENPSDVAKMFEDYGAKLIHIVDLDGAKEGDSINLSTITKIMDSINVDVEIGGGIRTKETIKTYVDMGIKRIILGTKVIENIEFLDELKDFQKNLVISIDLNKEYLATHGWLGSTDLHYSDFLPKLEKYNVNELIVTDIDKDGTLEGPNVELYQKMADEFPGMNIVASGGISNFDDFKNIIALDKSNITGIITGKAIYENKIDLKEVLKYVG